MAKPINYTVGARPSSRMSYVCYKKEEKEKKGKSVKNRKWCGALCHPFVEMVFLMNRATEECGSPIKGEKGNESEVKPCSIQSSISQVL